MATGAAKLATKAAAVRRAAEEVGAVHCDRGAAMRGAKGGRDRREDGRAVVGVPGRAGRRELLAVSADLERHDRR
eukprot:scaffold130600_cov90-Phaeocystis_antarctica.AAC.1